MRLENFHIYGYLVLSYASCKNRFQIDFTQSDISCLDEDAFEEALTIFSYNAEIKDTKF